MAGVVQGSHSIHKRKACKPKRLTDVNLQAEEYNPSPHLIALQLPKPKWEVELETLLGCPEDMTIEEWLEINPGNPRNKLVLRLVEQNKELQLQHHDSRGSCYLEFSEASLRLVEYLNKELKILKEEKLKIKEQKFLEGSEQDLLKLENSLTAVGHRVEVAAEMIRLLKSRYEEDRAEVKAIQLKRLNLDEALANFIKREDSLQILVEQCAMSFCIRSTNRRGGRCGMSLLLVVGLNLV